MRFVILAAAAAVATAATPALAEPFAGPFVGAEVGLDNYEVKAEDVFVAGDEYDGLSGNGLVGGIYAGYDMRLGDTTFVGIEANASLSGAKISVDDGVDSLRIRAKETYGATVRFGAMLNDNTGLYARAGWANTRFKATANGVSDSERDDALVLGAGLETRVGANTSLRVEYVRADYSDFVKNNQIKAGVGFRF